ncbi:GNAT family N-acetyltransferase [Agromyces endophyticus]|uniref:GNAT family N-acetyltransferase n=1 Tax=Agromyces sp. H17E-10 TaxID=2932244 RepID=UPI001FD62593|nr:GNAT family N-acetyltransferase [Agromyces sp. H17E-10]UOQ87686.1 GNAT family N-acetyltransferase [Agromyces sp. H17E-10]
MSEAITESESAAVDEAMPGVEFRPIAGDDLRMWLPESMAYYEAARLRAGDTPSEAKAAVEASVNRFFADGEMKPEHVLLAIFVDGDDAGWLWLGPWAEGGDAWWVWDVHVREPYRRRGLGRAAMRHAEQVAREHGSPTLGLNVFAYNLPAIELYESLGFEAASLHMAKSL